MGDKREKIRTSKKDFMAFMKALRGELEKSDEG